MAEQRSLARIEEDREGGEQGEVTCLKAQSLEEERQTGGETYGEYKQDESRGTSGAMAIVAI
jgi:hypothetical protein